MADRDYVLGTHQEELDRLGLQHRVWRERALDAWQRAGFGPGHTVLDVGCGPGYATADLSKLVGRVVAIDRSSDFLEALRRDRKQPNIETRELDLDRDPLDESGADGAWVRWVFAFLRDPRGLVRRIRASLRTGAALVIHEYFEYSTWRFTENSEIFEHFVATVVRSWRESGGEPNIARELVGWLEQEGFRIESLRPIIEVITPDDFMWQWPKTFVHVGLDRLVELKAMSASQAAAVRQEFARLEAMPHIRMFTPAVLEIIGRSTDTRR